MGRAFSCLMEENNSQNKINSSQDTDMVSNSLPEKLNLKTELEKTKQKMKFWAIIGGVLLLISICLAVFAYILIIKNDTAIKNINKSLNIKTPDTINKENINTENLVRRSIDGVYVEPGKENIYPLAFMIDNHVDARPQAGIDKAQLVIEAEAEGGITRYMAVFATDEKIDKIGPVRSARPYFVDWAKELSAVYVHVGGSPDALAKMIKEGTTHINEFYDGAYFWRGTDFTAPHNVFTSSEKMSEYLVKKEFTTGKFLTWKFKDDAKKEDLGTSTNIIIDFVLPDYKVEWQYDEANNNYKRLLGGKIHKSADEVELSAKNVIIQFVRGEVLDDAKRQSFQHIGEGKAVVCLDAYCRKGTWKKATASSRTRFYDMENNEFEFNAGKIWIEVVKPEYTVSY